MSTTSGMILFAAILILVPGRVGAQTPPEPASLKSASFETMLVLTDALLALQVKNEADPNYGAIACPECGVFHTRAAEAVYPLATAYRLTHEAKYLESARRLAAWLIGQQQPGGEWIETPWAWTGTTADQLLMLAEAHLVLGPELPTGERGRWKEAVRKASDFLVRVMDPSFASINYCPTSAAALLLANSIVPDPAYPQKARQLAHQVLAKMDEAGFIQGEAARAHGVKYGVDLGYEMDMSLWGLGLYARLSRDTIVDAAVRRSLAKNLPFVYPNGAIDGSWGARCYKWTTYGSKTADGAQILFALYGDEDRRYITAALRNLTYLRTMISNGMVGNGPHYWSLYPGKACVYPTFARAKNLALVLKYGHDGTEQSPSASKLPSDRPSWLRHYSTVDVAVARSANFMMTVSAYSYRDPSRTNDGQYNQHPTGGSVCNLWAEGAGFLTTSSQTRYVRGEPIHMPVAHDSALCLTPRLEYRDSLGYFTNLYEFEGRFTSHSNAESVAVITTSGELKDENWLPGGVAYSITNILYDDAVEKTFTLTFHDRRPTVRLIEPIVLSEGTHLEFVGARRVIIHSPNRTFTVDLLEGGARFSSDPKYSVYTFPFPAMKAAPLVVLVPPPSAGFVQTIRYRIAVEGKRLLDIPRDGYFTPQGALNSARRTYPLGSLPPHQRSKDVKLEKGVVYAKRGERALHLDILRPKPAAGKRVPAVLIIHGGGWRSGDHSMEMGMAERLAAKGYLAALVEYRLSPEALYPASLCDCIDAIAWLQEHAERYSIDTSRMAVMGGSSGGHLATLLGSLNDSIPCPAHRRGDALRMVKAVVNFDGPVDLTDPEESGKDSDPAIPSSAAQWLGVTFNERPELWRSVSPVFLVSKHTAPVLFVNSALPRYRAGRDEMVAKMKMYGIETEVVEIPDSPHTFWLLDPWIDRASASAIAFLDRHLTSTP